MRKRLVFLLICCFCLAVSPLYAVEIKVFGDMDITFEYNYHVRSFLACSQFQQGRVQGTPVAKFSAKQRMRPGLRVIFSEQLAVGIQLQLGGMNNLGVWGAHIKPEGQPGVAYQMNGTPQVRVRSAVLDWVIPQTDIRLRMGYAGYFIPSLAIPISVVLAPQTIPHVSLTIPIQEGSIVSFTWIRPESSKPLTLFPKGAEGGADFFIVNAPSRFENFSINPFAVFGFVGGGVDLLSNPLSSGEGGFTLRPTWFAIEGAVKRGYGGNLNWTPHNAIAWWLGGSVQVTKFAPFTFAFEGIYSYLGNTHAQNRRKGWYVGASAWYQTKWGTPRVNMWYASGDDTSVTNGSERIASISGGYNPGASSLFSAGRSTLATTLGIASPAGTWGISAQWNGLSFIEKLTHNIHVTYMQGTNSQRMLANVYNSGRDTLVHTLRTYHQAYLSTADSITEINVDSFWDIRPNLAAILEVGYVIPRFNTRLRTPVNIPSFRYSHAWRVALNFRYTF